MEKKTERDEEFYVVTMSISDIFIDTFPLQPIMVEEAYQLVYELSGLDKQNDFIEGRPTREEGNMVALFSLARQLSNHMQDANRIGEPGTLFDFLVMQQTLLRCSGSKTALETHKLIYSTAEWVQHIDQLIGSVKAQEKLWAAELAAPSKGLEHTGFT